MKVRELGPNIFQFIFEKNEEKCRVWNGRPWFFENQMIVLQKWEENIEHKKEDFNVSPLWVQVRNIPNHWVTKETGWKIGGLFEKVHDIWLSERGSKEGRFLKMLVSCNLTMPLLRGSMIRLNESATWVDFRYENLPQFCFYCGRVGHSETACDQRRKERNSEQWEEGQFGSWLRAANSKKEMQEKPGNSPTRNETTGRNKDKLTNGRQKEVAPNEICPTEPLISSQKLLVRTHSDDDQQMNGKGSTKEEKVNDGHVMENSESTETAQCILHKRVNKENEIIGSLMEIDVQILDDGNQAFQESIGVEILNQPSKTPPSPEKQDPNIMNRAVIEEKEWKEGERGSRKSSKREAKQAQHSGNQEVGKTMKRKWHLEDEKEDQEPENNKRSKVTSSFSPKPNKGEKGTNQDRCPNHQ